MKKYTVYEKIDYYRRLLNRTKDNSKKDFYKGRIRTLENSKEYTFSGQLMYNSNKRHTYLKKSGWKPDPNWTGD